MPWRVEKSNKKLSPSEGTTYFTRYEVRVYKGCTNCSGRTVKQKTPFGEGSITSDSAISGVLYHLIGSEIETLQQ